MAAAAFGGFRRRPRSPRGDPDGSSVEEEEDAEDEALVAGGGDVFVGVSAPFSAPRGGAKKKRLVSYGVDVSAPWEGRGSSPEGSERRRLQKMALEASWTGVAATRATLADRHPGGLTTEIWFGQAPRLGMLGAPHGQVACPCGGDHLDSTSQLGRPVSRTGKWQARVGEAAGPLARNAEALRGCCRGGNIWTPCPETSAP